MGVDGFHITYPSLKNIAPTHQSQPEWKTKSHKPLIPTVKRDAAWSGPITESAYPGKKIHRIGMYIPIPFDLFKRTPSRLFDIQARVQLSDQQGNTVALTTSKTFEFSHFVTIGADDNKLCRLFD